MSSISVDQQIKFVRCEGAIVFRTLIASVLASMKDYFEKAIDYFMKKFVQSQFPLSEPADSHHIEQTINFSRSNQGFRKIWRAKLIGLFSWMGETIEFSRSQKLNEMRQFTTKVIKEMIFAKIS
jgi:hypothetical protein